MKGETILKTSNSCHHFIEQAESSVTLFFLVVASLDLICHLPVINIIDKSTVQISRHVPHFSRALERVLIFKYVI